MKINKSIKVKLFNQEIGTLGYDGDLKTAFFQYHPNYLNQNTHTTNWQNWLELECQIAK